MKNVIKEIIKSPLLYICLVLIAGFYINDIFTDFEIFKNQDRFNVLQEIEAIESTCENSYDKCLLEVENKINYYKGNDLKSEIFQTLKFVIMCHAGKETEDVYYERFTKNNNIDLDNQRIKLGLCFVRNNKFKDAEAIFKSSIHRSAKFYLGQLYEIKKEKELAIETYTEIIEGMPPGKYKDAVSGFYKVLIENLESDEPDFKKVIIVSPNEHRTNY